MKELLFRLYDVFLSDKTFSGDLETNDVFFSVGLIMLLTAAVGMVVYYYAINHPRFNRWIHWLSVVIALCIVNFVIALAMSKSTLFGFYQEMSQEVPFPISDFIAFGFANAIWTAVFSFIFSMCMKWKSSTGKYSPF